MLENREVKLFNNSSADLCASGFFMGLGFRKEKPLLPIEPAKPDRIKQLEYEADQKALAECLNYSIDVAYKVNS